MKQYRFELLLLAAQFVMYYLFPLTCGPTDAMAMVFLILCSVFLLALLEGGFSSKRIKLAWPAAVSLLFLPSVPIWYNSSALVHALWYLVISAVGLALGCLVRFLVRLPGRKRSGS